MQSKTTISLVRLLSTKQRPETEQEINDFLTREQIPQDDREPFKRVLMGKPDLPVRITGLREIPYFVRGENGSYVPLRAVTITTNRAARDRRRHKVKELMTLYPCLGPKALHGRISMSERMTLRAVKHYMKQVRLEAKL